MRKITLFLLTISTIFASNIQPKINECVIDKDYHSCNFVGDTLLFQDKDDESDTYYMRAKAIMETSCYDNDLSACYTLGVNYELGSLVYPKSSKKAMKYYSKVIEHNKKLCENKSGSACFKLGLDYSERGILNNPISSKEYFKKACELGTSSACDRIK